MRTHILVVALLVFTALGQADWKINSMTYLSDFALGRQTDLNETFDALAKKVKLP